MDTRVNRQFGPWYCDMGQHQGHYRIDLSVSLYLSADEYDQYQRTPELEIVIADETKDELPRDRTES